MTHIFSTLKEFLGELYSPVIVIARIAGIIILSIIIVKLGSRAIKKIFEKQKTLKYGFNTKRIDTMATILTSVFGYAVYIIAIITILAKEFKMSSVLAAAGVGGIAIGLGAQGLIKDIIAGFFIIMEDQFVVGDLVTIETMTGTVEEMGLRISKLRNPNGDLHMIPNGEIKKITNHTRGNKAAIVDIPLGYGADVSKVVELVNEVCEKVSKEFITIVEAPKVLGITEFGKDSMNIRVIAKTLPGEQWEVERRIRKLIREEAMKDKLEFDIRDIIVSEEKK